MSTASSSLIVPTDFQLASMIVANMLENCLDFPSNVWTTAEVTDEPENLGTATEQAETFAPAFLNIVAMGETA